MIGAVRKINALRGFANDLVFPLPEPSNRSLLKQITAQR